MKTDASRGWPIQHSWNRHRESRRGHSRTSPWSRLARRGSRVAARPCADGPGSGGADLARRGLIGPWEANERRLMVRSSARTPHVVVPYPSGAILQFLRFRNPACRSQKSRVALKHIGHREMVPTEAVLHCRQAARVVRLRLGIAALPRERVGDPHLGVSCRVKPRVHTEFGHDGPQSIVKRQDRTVPGLGACEIALSKRVIASL